LIIDDDKEIAVLFRTVLSIVGFHCEIALSARDALARLATSVPDLILLDLRLGIEIGGEDILYQIRSNPRFDNTRVIVITAHPAIADLVSDLSDLVLLKPVEVDQLSILAKRIGSFEVGPKRFSFRDPVTQLFNRSFFLTRIELAFERSRRRPDFLFAALFIQLKHQSGQNDQIDSDLAVGILQETARRLRSSLRPTDTIARLSGWRFATLHEELKNPDDIKVIINRIRGRLSESYQVGGSLYQVTPYFGVAQEVPNIQHPEDFLSAAEQSLEEALSVES
jgi:diguanylate cyclase (GGDEF)-like protein